MVSSEVLMIVTTGTTNIGPVEVGGLGLANVPPATEIVTDQAYYWSPAWQEAERETLARLAAGEGVVFEDGVEAARWLLNEEE